MGHPPFGAELGYESLRLMGNGTESVSDLKSYLVDRAILFFNELQNGAGLIPALQLS